ncbi:hypothetical protein G7Y89_g5022 [Cudoniella acicularis]|uniref:Heterokaryon incompatibility domain-containing protein n=1 Tax=Cudoniella acicularis TaxID=354080 RepID=A0A8H4RP27_9HELO|nr:hypothetical protein G7Y89_g5022 [Cudoniella acicularis]
MSTSFVGIGNNYAPSSPLRFLSRSPSPPISPSFWSNPPFSHLADESPEPEVVEQAGLASRAVSAAPPTASAGPALTENRVIAVPKKRGRPPTKPPKDENAPPKRRGRPPKPKPEVDPDAPPKKRGRPPKNRDALAAAVQAAIVINDSEDDDVVEEEPAPKRARRERSTSIIPPTTRTTRSSSVQPPAGRVTRSRSRQPEAGRASRASSLVPTAPRVARSRSSSVAPVLKATKTTKKPTPAPLTIKEEPEEDVAALVPASLPVIASRAGVEPGSALPLPSALARQGATRGGVDPGSAVMSAAPAFRKEASRGGVDPGSAITSAGLVVPENASRGSVNPGSALTSAGPVSVAAQPAAPLPPCRKRKAYDPNDPTDPFIPEIFQKREPPAKKAKKADNAPLPAASVPATSVRKSPPVKLRLTVKNSPLAAPIPALPAPTSPIGIPRLPFAVFAARVEAAQVPVAAPLAPPPAPAPVAVPRQPLPAITTQAPVPKVAGAVTRGRAARGVPLEAIPESPVAETTIPTEPKPKGKARSPAKRKEPAAAKAKQSKGPEIVVLPTPLDLPPYEEGNILYFSYGPDMAASYMEVAHYGARLVSLAKLSDHRFLINRATSKAEIVPAAGHVVWGLVWAVSQRDFNLLSGAGGAAVIMQQVHVDFFARDKGRGWFGTETENDLARGEQKVAVNALVGAVRAVAPGFAAGVEQQTSSSSFAAVAAPEDFMARKVGTTVPPVASALGLYYAYKGPDSVLPEPYQNNISQSLDQPGPEFANLYLPVFYASVALYPTTQRQYTQGLYCLWEGNGNVTLTKTLKTSLATKSVIVAITTTVLTPRAPEKFSQRPDILATMLISPLEYSLVICSSVQNLFSKLILQLRRNEDQEFLPFCYKPLNDGEIRVLSFKNQDVTSETVQLSMCHISREVPVTKNGKPVVEKSVYSALSYTWGQSPTTKLIILNDCKFYVNSNLESALRRLRRHQNSPLNRFLWIDAICIDQSNNPEKCAQVVLMKKTYEYASQVIVWLGEERIETTQLAVDLLKNHIKIEGSEVSLSQYSAAPAAWQAFGGDLMKRDWWKRVWVIQEIAVSWHASPIVMCGPYMFSWTHLAIAAYYAEASDLPIFTHTAEEIARGDVYLPTIRWKSAYRQRLSQGQPLPILEMMANSVSCAASDPRDKIYSLLGLATDIKSVPVANDKRLSTVTTPKPSVNSNIELICDYEKSVEEVYTDFVRVHANTHKSLDIICSTRHAVGQLEESLKESLNLPSWVPDWSTLLRTSSNPLPRVHLEPGYPPQYFYNASSGVDPDFEFFDTDCLLAFGTSFDTVKHVGDRYLDSNPPGKEFYNTLQGWRQVALGTQFDSAVHPYVGGGNMLDAFRRTITCDQDRYGERVKVDGNLFDPNACFIDYGDRVFADPTDTLIGDDVFSLLRQCLLHQNSPSFKNTERAVYLRTQRRRFFVTERGYFGLGTANTEIGDEVFVLSGCSVPVILRKKTSHFVINSGIVATLARDTMFEGYWYFVGESFVTGIMDGEVVKQGGKFERVLLR